MNDIPTRLRTDAKAADYQVRRARIFGTEGAYVPISDISDWASLMRAAADEIERLNAERKKVSAALRTIAMAEATDPFEAMCAEAEAALAEIARLREALNDIAAAQPMWEGGVRRASPAALGCLILHMRDTASAALSPASSPIVKTGE